MRTLPARLEYSLSFHASRLALALRREQLIALKPYQLTPEQWQVLAVLWEFDTASQSDLAAITMRDEPSISRMVRNMETNGWVERRIDAVDGRTRRIHPTAKAWESRAELFSALDSRLRAIHDILQPEVLDGLMDQVKLCANQLEVLNVKEEPVAVVADAVETPVIAEAVSEELVETTVDASPEPVAEEMPVFDRDYFRCDAALYSAGFAEKEIRATVEFDATIIDKEAA